MKKIVINSDFGGFGLSRATQDYIISAKGVDSGKWNSDYESYSNFYFDDLTRDDPSM